MIFSNDRRELRKMFVEAWRRHRDKQPLSPLQAQIAAVIEWHPEYHEILTEHDLDLDYVPEGGRTNPFLHLGLHLGIRDQVATDRPAGIAAVHDALLKSLGDAHAAEHRMIDVLAETLWEAQGTGGPPDEQRYLERLRALLR